jgi:hypothetical protein
MNPSTRIMVATPMYGGQGCANYIETLLQIKHWSHTHNIYVEFVFRTNQSSISHARNDLTQEFMDSNCTHLFWLDADVGFSPEPHLTEMVDQDLPVVVGTYPKKQIDWDLVRQLIAEGVDNDTLARNCQQDVIRFRDPKSPRDRTYPVTHSGAGLMLIQRSAFERFRQHHGEHQAYDNYGKPCYNYWGMAVNPTTRGYVSEDTFFCDHWRMTGGEVIWLPWIRATHQGSYRFGDPRQ